MSIHLKDYPDVKKLIEEQDTELRRIAASPLLIATVITQDDKHVMIANDGRITRVLSPTFKLKPGDEVLIYAETRQIVEKHDKKFGLGKICVVREAGKERSEIEQEGSVIVVLNGEFQPKNGDRVVLDSSNSLIVANIGQATARFTPEAVPNVTWDDIGGLDEAKAQMIEAVELPHRNRKIFEFYGKRPSRGILLYGPPGCGKTLLGKAAANALAKIYEKEGAGSGFMYVKAPEILDKYVGASEAMVRSIFERARAHKAKHGYPAIVFIDEADAILGKRGEQGTSFMTNTIVPMFLAEMDGMEETCAIVILATNRPDILDPAIVRDGRVDRKIKVTRPTYESAVEILHLNLKKVPVMNDASHAGLAEAAAAELFSDERVLYEIETHRGEKVMTLANAINGGMIAGVVDYALSLAIRRDLAENKRTGLCVADILSAVDRIDRQSRDLNHENEIKEFAESFAGAEITGIRKAA